MQIEIKKQITSKIEIETPCYLKTSWGTFCYINPSGILLLINKHSYISISQPTEEYYGENVERMLQYGCKCDRIEFESAYADTVNVMGVLVKPQVVGAIAV